MFAASLVLGLDDTGLAHTPLNVTAISSRDGYSVLQCWQLASIPIDAMQAANYPVGNTTVATWSRIEPKTHVGEAWAPHVQLSVILNGLIRITSPAPATDPATGMYLQTGGREGTMHSHEINESMLISTEQQHQLPTIVEAATNDHAKNAKAKRPETHVAYIMPGTLKSSVVIAADLKSVSTIAGHYTEFPSNTEPTILVQIPFEGDRAPEHTILHDGPCV
ncbi:hypothetical protein QBC37DRAFT_289929 [Rhypophila decipiens]|uniref:Uncharacterized protein n=1 Tax=Rhypophila decipiens TaxID=261697 RepID=A0AAN7B5H2_9PEZI|nr:hypothetical protein QBC37DRAFT_289929 [Rhypophila decipiens]